MSTLSPKATELTVGELAERAGVAVSTLHFYESKGLISSRRTAGNQRRFRRDTLRRIAFIRIGQRVGIPLNTIREMLDGLPDGRLPDRADWAEVSLAWRADLDARIEQLLQLRDDFSDCVGCGCLSLDRCALANNNDRLGEQGAGPRRLLSRRTATRGQLGQGQLDQGRPDRGPVDPCSPDQPSPGRQPAPRGAADEGPAAVPSCEPGLC